jgi:O-phosphoseryl-tRNA(Cys) synthetase
MQKLNINKDDFNAIYTGVKLFIVHSELENLKKGDELCLCENNALNGSFSGREIHIKATDVLQNPNLNGFTVFSFVITLTMQ